MPPKVHKRYIQREEETLEEAVGAASHQKSHQNPRASKVAFTTTTKVEIEIEFEVAIPADVDDISDNSRRPLAATPRRSRDTDSAAHTNATATTMVYNVRPIFSLHHGKRNSAAHPH
ncbi:hypothetical protein D9615_007787 [Tricholomella constricta]|uniref:Uncharacterized protein n=1 Tax=Tricholomella constricta TaxID=117010 RepID=A0A8H5H4Z5_9AGAR|nr:hypothetical protein D9615_007787 [Tricholomella constricta]